MHAEKIYYYHHTVRACHVILHLLIIYSISFTESHQYMLQLHAFRMVAPRNHACLQTKLNLPET